MVDQRDPEFPYAGLGDRQVPDPGDGGEKREAANICRSRTLSLATIDHVSGTKVQVSTGVCCDIVH